MSKPMAYLQLVCATLFWAGNAIAGKLAAGTVTPVALTFYRWLGASLVLLVMTRAQLRRDAQALAAAAPRLFALGAIGFAGFNFALYHALHYTTALNVTIEQSCMPVLIALGGLLLFRERASHLQLLGIALTVCGVLVTVAHGDPISILHMDLNRGDGIMLLGVLCYAGYTLGLRYRPAVHPGSLLCALALAATLTSAVAYLPEAVAGPARIPPRGWALIAYTALLPSLVSQLFYIRGVAALGATRAGLFVNLVPIFGAALSVALLGEQLRAFHVLGLLLVLGGIGLAERHRPRAAAA